MLEPPKVIKSFGFLVNRSDAVFVELKGTFRVDEGFVGLAELKEAFGASDESALVARGHLDGLKIGKCIKIVALMVF